MSGRPPSRSSEVLPLSWREVAGADARCSCRSAHVPDLGQVRAWPLVAYRPVPPQVEQTAGAQVCTIPVQVHAAACARPPPLQIGHGPLLLVVVLVLLIASSRTELVASHLVTFTR